VPPGTVRGVAVGAEKRTAEANRAAVGYDKTLKIERGFMIATVDHLTKEQAVALKRRFEREGWSATCKNRYTQVRAERKI
jgi:hypothetical protein